MLTVVWLVTVGKPLRSAQSNRYRYAATYTFRYEEETHEMPIVLDCYYALDEGDMLLVSGEITHIPRKDGGWITVVRVNKTFRVRGSNKDKDGERSRQFQGKPAGQGKPSGGNKPKASSAPARKPEGEVSDDENVDSEDEQEVYF